MSSRGEGRGSSQPPPEGRLAIVPTAIWQLPHAHVGGRVEVWDEIASTNDRAAEIAADPVNAGTVVLARRQSRGRGQYGRVWQAGESKAVLMSALLLPPPELRRPVPLTAWAAVAVCRTLEAVAGLSPIIKWPNDVLVAGKKVCGILIEGGVGVVAGVGLNVRQTAADFGDSGLPDAASLLTLTGIAFDTDAVARSLIAELDAGLGRLLAGDLAGLESDWATRLGLLGREAVAVEHGGGEFSGTVMGIGFGGVYLTGNAGVPRRLAPETLKALRPA